jgi:hypothetical protein
VPSVEALEALDVTERQPVLLPDPDSQEPLPI